MNQYLPWLTWAASSVAVVCVVLSTWVLQRWPARAVLASAFGTGAAVVVMVNEATRPEPTAYVGVWALIVASTFLNWQVCRRAEYRHHRRMMETLELLADLHRMHMERQKLIEENDLMRGERGEGGVGIWPPKEC